MRFILTLLLGALLVLSVWSFVSYESFLGGPSPANYQWWWPREISTFGQEGDGLFRMIAVMVLVMFIGTMGMLTYCVFKYGAPRQDKGIFSHGHHQVEMTCFAVVAGLLLIVVFIQMGPWADMKYAGATEDEPIFGEIWASQFDWRFRYPGPDGRLGTADDIETAWELVVPKDTKVVMNLRSRDVLHSFFVPMLRLKQDAVPGMTIPIWFEVDGEQHAEAFEGEEDTSFDIICAELCGWGHYKMSGRVRVLEPEEFEVWMAEMVAERFSNGQIEGE